MPNTRQDWRLLPIRHSDAEGLAQVHGDSFPTGWNAADLAGFAEDAACDGLAAHAGAALAGFVIPRVAADEAEILTLAVAPRWRRRGVGASLLAAALAAAVRRGAAAIFLEVAADNGAALALYDRFGFVRVGSRAGYYRLGDGVPAADAVTLRRSLGG